MRTLALIPARAGSKGIPGKNARKFAGGMTLVDRATAIGYQTCDHALLSTDDYAAMRPGGSGVHAPRPPELAADDTPMLPVVQHALQWWNAYWPAEANPDVIVLLQPTQPLRKPEHIKEALRLLEETKADSVVSVVQIPAHYSPDYAMAIVQKGEWFEGESWPPRATHLTRYLRDRPERTSRQGCNPAYSRDGTVYAIKRETIEAGSLYGSHCVPLIIPSNESCNLDSEEDWQRAEAMVKR